MKDVLWIMPPKRLINSGVYKYSDLIINSAPNIQKLHLPNNKLRYIFQFLILPFILIFSSMIYKKVIFAEEGYGFLVPFFLREKIIIVHDIRTSDEVTSFKEWLKSIYIKLSLLGIRYSNKIICVSKFTENSLKSNNICDFSTTSVSVIYNAIEKEVLLTDGTVDKKLVDFVNNAKQFPNKVVFLYVGSDETRKNTIALVKALNSASPTFSKNIFLLKVGRPINESNFELVNKQLVSSNNITGFLCLSEVSSIDLDYVYSMSDVFIMPSTFEGFGRTPIEAQCYGLPVISTDAAALAEVLGDSCIRIPAPYGSEQIKFAIDKWLSCYNNQDLILTGHQNAQRFSKESVVKQFKEFIQ
ncbi:glycosyltransferase [Paraglaciecola psychrophila]|uniref:Glycosyl transferase family 1 domain-containing protein n=1 Tax=Paraglaciecola psychrophila 170 TaxID=1129794 RepID=K7A0L7_9ALTE|nr:glycosyltransferase [Paraglaciecola psychrophila]AGH43751.1 hypothetical protein C427_1642 [Paraglaciecola psychrophila 170]GAC35957.1 hypothetical protein GPSY_0315 [Paraglaciecola psychrophila 170]